MYQERHYPNWDNRALWIGDSIKDENSNLVGLRILHPIDEGGETFPEWHGLVKAAIYVINPLNLKYPDNTNSGRDDVDISELEAVDMDELEEKIESLVNQNFNYHLMAEFYHSVKNSGDLLGVSTSVGYNYWFASFSVIDLYEDGETGAECWDRISKKYGVLDFLASSVSNGELQEGMLSYLERKELELPEQGHRLDEGNLSKLENELLALREELVGDLVNESDSYCSMGLLHKCKRGNETESKVRGRDTVEEAYLPAIDKWEKADFKGEHTPNRRSVENFKKLVYAFEGDGYAIFPTVNDHGDVVLDWKVGPNHFGQAVLAGDGTMHLSFEFIESNIHKMSIPSQTELKASRTFNEHVLTDFINTGVLPE